MDSPSSSSVTQREFHLRREARERYGISGPVFAPDGDSVQTSLLATRNLAHRMNQTRDLLRHPAQAVRASDLNALGLLDEVFHHVTELFLEANGEAVFSSALAMLDQRFTDAQIDECLLEFVRRYPPTPVFNGTTTAEEFFAGTVESRNAREMLLEELMMLELQNSNPALDPLQELIEDEELSRDTAYRQVTGALAGFFREQPPFGPDSQSLVEMLGTPARLYPTSLERQLEYIYERWGSLLGAHLFRLLRALDVLREDSKARFPGPGPAIVHRYDGNEPERFSADQEWMPGVVLMAKSALVWLDQLSRQHGRTITRLDEIPDEELDQLAEWGFTGLWLIGVWQRSPASKQIKIRMGNPEAEASAYSLFDYTIAPELGGWDALDNLRYRAVQRGIRLASDMVPNHTGIDSRWIIDHPDWFLQLDHAPFPAYSFTGEDLSSNPDIQIQLEDHYYTRSDAAVIFKRTDRRSGRARYIYHGNDGTSMPWNDTAQLDYLNPEVREAVIQTIVHVARHFPIIRFDAAMTLAKKHIRRLWYPEPGSGGDIPSRAEHGLSQQEFDTAMPQEFWREVVDRVAEAAPHTLLLAEAFWMMEGYFVRTLGMHRVYNSAFMNMLKHEENAKYRQAIKNTLEFDPGILKRFVNFMNNPDEETAVAQFGKGDKYTGVCTLMVTMPGLPMFGHGQIEGYGEKYGMEYRRAYWNEQPDRELVARHEHQVFPLMRRRRLFSEATSFQLYDVFTESGSVNENVFAYSNRHGGEHVLVLYNNSYEHARGWIRTSTARADTTTPKREHSRTDLADALGIQIGQGRYAVFREHRSGLWFIRSGQELKDRGLYVDLAGYQSQVFVDFHQVSDDEHGYYAQLADELRGRGVESIENTLREFALRPLLDSFSGVANSRTFKMVGQALRGDATLDEPEIDQVVAHYGQFLRLARDYRSPMNDVEIAIERLNDLLSAAQKLPYLDLAPAQEQTAVYRRATALVTRSLRDDSSRRDCMVLWLFLSPLVSVYSFPLGVVEEWGLIPRAFRAFGTPEHDPSSSQLVKLLMSTGSWWTPSIVGDPRRLMTRLLSDGDVAVFLGLNEYDDAVWYNKERLDEFIWWLYVTGLISILIEKMDSASRTAHIVALYRMQQQLATAHQRSGYRADRFLDGLGLSANHSRQPRQRKGARREKS
jgi:glycosidase